jgi:hypothetical protein
MKAITFMMLISIILCTSCNKEDAANFSSVSGKLTAGNNMTSVDLSKLQVFLWQINDSIDLKKLDALNLPASTFLDSMTVNADGAFSFDNLPNGKYIISISEGYLLGTETISAFVIDGKTANVLDRSIQKIAPQNADIYAYPASKIKAGAKIVRHKFEIVLKIAGAGRGVATLSGFNIEENGSSNYNINVPRITTNGGGWSFEADLDEKATINVTLRFQEGGGTRTLPWNSLNGVEDNFAYGPNMQEQRIYSTLFRVGKTKIEIVKRDVTLTIN